ncbi:hypothetical protein CesoFtcFv8_012169 [Champsocephalus esox]|uniref:Immunoglobulin V-set domain-containing protein n=1 Tax=Champsocephalus esox TaxID=159716 RepID=A0AAN8BX28_9TELE|nr:hypothetical protein CesoFtcFv8_012169 [Champsocephalus esox]
MIFIIFTMTNIFAYSCLLSALSFGEMKILNIRGSVGERVRFKCSDWNNVFGVRSNDKYFCRSPCTKDKHVIIKAASGKTTQGNRIEIFNRGNNLFVTFTNLKKSDANIYYCGVKRNGLDPWIKVVLKVADAASYGPTPETVDTITTLPPAVSNSSTLPSNSSDNITDVSASNTTTTTTTPPATQEAGSKPYLIIGVILLITLPMVLLKVMSKKMMKQRKVVATAAMPLEDAQEVRVGGKMVSVRFTTETFPCVRLRLFCFTFGIHFIFLTEAEYDEIRREEATDPDSLYANNSFLQDIGSAAARCETDSRGPCAESRDNVLYSVAQLPKDQMKPTGQSQPNQSGSAGYDSFYDLAQVPQAP